MIADSDFHVWLDRQLELDRAVLTPFVQTRSNADVHYDIKLSQQAGGGNSSIRQNGKVTAGGGQATVLSRLTVSSSKNIRCEMEVKVRVGDGETGETRVYVFDCSRSE